MATALRTPTHLWIAGGLATLWNGFGATDYFMTQTKNEPYLAAFTDAQRAYFDGFPDWADAAWALGVWGALLGSLLLLARSRHAVAAFGASLVGLFASSVYQHGLSDMPAEFRSAPMIGMSVFIWVVAVALLVYARRQRARGVLR